MPTHSTSALTVIAAVNAERPKNGRVLLKALEGEVKVASMF